MIFSKNEKKNSKPFLQNITIQWYRNEISNRNVWHAYNEQKTRTKKNKKKNTQKQQNKENDHFNLIFWLRKMKENDKYFQMIEANSIK